MSQFQKIYIYIYISHIYICESSLASEKSGLLLGSRTWVPDSCQQSEISTDCHQLSVLIAHD